jgi:hypothetical protein
MLTTADAPIVVSTQHVTHIPRQHHDIIDSFDSSWSPSGGGGQNEQGNTHRLLEAIEQQKRVVEIELARLREAAGQAQDWHAQPIEAPPFHFIQRQHPRVVVNKFEENNEEHRLMKKTRANWNLPTITQQIPTATTMMLPQQTPDEVYLFNESHPSLADHQHGKKLRMVTHFGKQPASDKPPVHHGAPKSRNNAQKTLNKNSIVSEVNPLNEGDTPEKKDVRKSSFKLAAENILNFEKKRREMKKSFRSRDAMTPDNNPGARSALSTI